MLSLVFDIPQFQHKAERVSPYSVPGSSSSEQTAIQERTAVSKENSECREWAMICYDSKQGSNRIVVGGHKPTPRCPRKGPL